MGHFVSFVFLDSLYTFHTSVYLAVVLSYNKAISLEGQNWIQTMEKARENHSTISTDDCYGNLMFTNKESQWRVITANVRCTEHSIPILLVSLISVKRPRQNIKHDYNLFFSIVCWSILILFGGGGQLI